MELKEFPFDEQDLNILFIVRKPIFCVTLIPNFEYPSTFSFKNFMLYDIFDVSNGERVDCYVEKSDPKESVSKAIYGKIGFSVNLQRKSGLFIILLFELFIHDSLLLFLILLLLFLLLLLLLILLFLISYVIIFFLKYLKSKIK
jgi:hypothetical protein